MVENKLLIDDEFFEFKSQKIFWKEIVCVRLWTNPILLQLNSSGRLPIAEIFLSDGKMLVIPSYVEIENLYLSTKSSQKYKDFYLFVDILKSKNAYKTIFLTLREKTVLGSILVAEFLAIPIGLLLRLDINALMPITIFVGIFIGVISNFVSAKKIKFYNLQNKDK